MDTLLTPDMLRRLLRPRPVDAHKGTMGHALMVAGRKDVAGCAMLAAEACLRSGAGKLTVHTTADNRIPLHLAVPEAILRTEEDDCVSGVVADATTYQAIGIGPGIGLRSIEATHAYLSQTTVPMVVDADALRILAQHPEWMPMLRGRAVLTPHGGEAQALAKGFCLETMLQLAKAHDVVVVAKGAPTAICLPDGSTLTCPRGNAGMATAGSGDVLTGLITGFLAQGYTPADAATLGVWLHATAGDSAARELGQACLLARDLIRHLPPAFRELTEHASVVPPQG